MGDISSIYLAIVAFEVFSGRKRYFIIVIEIVLILIYYKISEQLKMK